MKKETQIKLNKLVENIVKKQLSEVTEFNNLEDFIKSYKIEVIKDIDEKSKQIKVWTVYKVSQGAHYTAAVCASKKSADLILTQLKLNDLEQLNYDFKIEEGTSEIYLNRKGNVVIEK